MSEPVGTCSPNSVHDAQQTLAPKQRDTKLPTPPTQTTDERCKLPQCKASYEK